MDIKEALEKIRSYKKRNFVQTIDLIVTLRNIDLKKPENRVTKEVVLPHGIGRDIKVCLITKDNGFTKEKIEEIGSDKKAAKKFAKSYDFFLASAELMPVIGKVLGRFLAPAGKMPSPILPNMSKEDIDKLIEQKKKSVIIKLKTQPQVQIPVGKEDMNDDEIKENIEHALHEIIKSLPKGKSHIKQILIKGTMTPAYRIEVKL
jgi:large subunit ribosomal protein L1